MAGKVLIDGEPVTTGSIQFVPEGGRPFAGKIGKDGSFRLAELSVSETAQMPGVAAGRYRVGVSSTEIVDETDEELVKYIPAKYADFRTSDLEVEITGPKKDLIIDLTWEGAEELEEAAEEESAEEEDPDQAESEEANSEAAIEE